MAIRWITNGNILDSPADMLVNPVNCIGVSGKGLAKAFADRFPANQEAYAQHCRDGLMRPGEVFGHNIHQDGKWRTIANFATKDHWKDPSQLHWIESGLTGLIDLMRDESLDSMAVPALGCGLGGLAWADVKPLIERHLGFFEVTFWAGEPDQCEIEADVEVYEPH